MRNTPFILPLLAILALTRPAAAQPWASEVERQSGMTALAAVNAGRVIDAEIAAGTADPLVRKYVFWIRLQRRDSGASAAELISWLAANPDWPLPDTMARRTEEALANSPDDALALTYFTRSPARTLAGAARHADALARAGRQKEADALLRQAWLSLQADAEAEPAFGARVASLMTPEEQWRRFDQLSLSRDLNDAARQVAWLSPTDRARAELRLAYANDRPDAPEPSTTSATDLGLLSAEARWLRRRERDSEAAALWSLAAPLQRNLAPDDARAIWVERQVLSRKLLRLGQADLAYTVAAQHGQEENGEARQEGEFLAGFIALRRLNDPTTAAAHFARLGVGSKSVLTNARAAYWQGVAAEALGDGAMARLRYAEGAAYPVAFYGQLSAMALGDSPAQLATRISSLPSPPVTPEAANLFAAREMTRVVVALADLGESRRTRVFLLRMEDLSPDAGDRLLIARLARHIGRPDNGVWISRRAWADGVILLREGWPSPYPTPSDVLEPALTEAIARQESNFDKDAVSGSNARGLMQLLPGTAAQVAKQLGIPSTTPRLTSDPALNLRLGSAYLSQMLDRYGGNLVMAAAAYNAGPRRVDEWRVTYGDPNGGQVAILDWIEQIPFNETRNYVQRVVENAVVYRAIDGNGPARDHPLSAWLQPHTGSGQAVSLTP